jgi:hypothetical protein
MANGNVFQLRTLTFAPQSVRDSSRSRISRPFRANHFILRFPRVETPGLSPVAPSGQGPKGHGLARPKEDLKKKALLLSEPSRLAACERRSGHRE